MKKIKYLALIFILLFATSCKEQEELGEVETIENITYQETNQKTNNVIILLSDERKIAIQLYEDVAPISVANFQKLVSQKFYDGVIFHRVIKKFMIQTGDGTSLGRNANTIKGEFASNGFNNTLSHERGVVSMARASDYNSASSQFFIVQEDSTYLDGNYAAFGRVIAGMDVVDAISSVVTDSNDKPLKDITIEKIRFIKVVDENE